jgi:predicted transcriptional regulator
MEDAPPVVSIKTSIEVVSNLLRHFPIVVVGKSGELKGIITKSDLLKQVYS